MKNNKKFSETKFGNFITKVANTGLDVVSVIGKAKSGDFVGAFNEAKEMLSKSPNPEHGGFLTELLQNAENFRSDYELFLEDTQDARVNETARDISENSSFLSKNVHEIIALAVVGAWLVSWYLKPKIDYGEITSIVSLILGYLYGRTKPQV